MVQTRRMAQAAAAAPLQRGLPSVTHGARHYKRLRRDYRNHARDQDREAQLRALFSNGNHCLLQVLAPNWGHCTPNLIYTAGPGGVFVPLAPAPELVQRQDFQMFNGTMFHSPVRYSNECEAPPANPAVAAAAAAIPLGLQGHMPVPILRWGADLGLGANVADWAHSLYAVADGDSLFAYEGQMDIVGAAPAAGAPDARRLTFNGFMTCPVTDQCMYETEVEGPHNPRPVRARCATNLAARNSYGLTSRKYAREHRMAVDAAGESELGQNPEHLAAATVQEIVDGLGGPVHLMLGPTVIVPAQRPPGPAVDGIAWDAFPHRRGRNRAWEDRAADARAPPVVFDRARWRGMTRLRTLALEFFDFKTGYANEMSQLPGARMANGAAPNTLLARERLDTRAWIRNMFVDEILAGFQLQDPPHPGLDLLVVAGLNTITALDDVYQMAANPDAFDWLPVLEPLVNPNGGKIVLLDYDQESHPEWRFLEPFAP